MIKKKSNLTTFCISHKYIHFLDNLDLNIIGSGSYKKKYPKNWFKDNSNTDNISNKNKNYGTLTSIYYLWKNKIKTIKKNDYIGVCHYRRFWLKKKHSKKISIINLKKNILREIPKNYQNYDAFVCEPINLKGYKLSKLIKKAKINILNDPSILFNKKKHTINLHFDIFHIYNGLIDAANLLDDVDKKDFLKYIKTKNEFFPLSIFILRKKYFVDLCSSTFTWLEKCEKIFDKNKLNGYGEIRLFDFLAERYFSFWISKYCKYKIWPYSLIETKK